MQSSGSANYETPNFVVVGSVYELLELCNKVFASAMAPLDKAFAVSTLCRIVCVLSLCYAINLAVQTRRASLLK